MYIFTFFKLGEKEYIIHKCRWYCGKWNGSRQTELKNSPIRGWGGVVMRELYSVGCIGVLPFIEDLSETVQSGLVASSRDSEEHA